MSKVKLYTDLCCVINYFSISPEHALKTLSFRGLLYLQIKCATMTELLFFTCKTSWSPGSRIDGRTTQTMDCAVSQNGGKLFVSHQEHCQRVPLWEWFIINCPWQVLFYTYNNDNVQRSSTEHFNTLLRQQDWVKDCILHSQFRIYLSNKSYPSFTKKQNAFCHLAWL